MTVAEIYQQHKKLLPTIRERLAEFASVKQEDWFYEFSYCLLTPQSKAEHAGKVVTLLRELKFKETGSSPLHLLARPEHYIRFHNVKSHRLQLLQQNWSVIEQFLLRNSECKTHNPRQVRDELAKLVIGYGLKEASHALRNIGWREMAILDRHILRCLVQLNVYKDVPILKSVRSYHDIELQLIEYSQSIKINIDELDLVFWSIYTGNVLK